MPALAALPLPGKLLLVAGTVVASTAFFSTIRWLRNRFAARPLRSWSLSNTVYEVVVKENGEVYSRSRDRDYDISRRSYDLLDPAGRALFVVDRGPSPFLSWPVIGNFPDELADAPRIEPGENSLKVCSTRHGLRTTIEISLPSVTDPAELWTITVENLSDTARPIK